MSKMNSFDEFILFKIKEKLKENRMKITDLSKLVDISYPHLINIMNKRCKLTLENFIKICIAFRIDYKSELLPDRRWYLLNKDKKFKITTKLEVDDK